MTTTTHDALPRLLLPLRLTAVLLALLGIVQAGLGGHGFTGGPIVAGHGAVGFLTLAVALVAAVLAWLATRAAANKGLFFHAAGMAVIAFVQVGLGEAHVRGIHMGLGVLFLVGAVALATLAWRKPLV